MASSSIFGSTGRAAHRDHLAGALIVSFAVMALSDVGRALRGINVSFGVWLGVTACLLAGGMSA